VIWFVLSARHWRQLLPLQYCIAGVIALGMIEGATWYFEFLALNLEGETYLSATMIGIAVSTLKRTVSRVLVLVVSMGYGVVKPTLGTTKQKMACLAVLYFVFSGALATVEALQRPNQPGNAVQLLFVFPVALLDLAFYWWICLSLFRTIAQLSQCNQVLKLQMYKCLFVTLIISGIVSALISVLQLFLMALSNQDEQWRTWWVWTAFWHGLYFIVLMVIAILWRPSSNNLRNAYSDTLEDKEEVEYIALQPMPMGLGDMVKRRKDEEKIMSLADKVEITSAVSDISVSMELKNLLEDEDSLEPSKVD